MTAPAEVRFVRFVELDERTGCALWTGAKNRSGYGRFSASTGRVVYAHRFSYELAHGPIPDGLTIDHLCRVHACVNPTHLEAVTQAENTRRAQPFVVRELATSCKNGHDRPLGAERGNRCPQCNREGVAAWRRANRERVNAYQRATYWASRKGREVA